IQFNLSDNVEYQHRQCVDEIKVTQLDDYRYRVSFQDLVPMTKIPMRRINYFLNGDSQRFSEMKNYFRELHAVLNENARSGVDGVLYYSHPTGFMYLDTDLNKISSNEVSYYLDSINAFLQ